MKNKPCYPMYFCIRFGSQSIEDFLRYLEASISREGVKAEQDGKEVNIICFSTSYLEKLKVFLNIAFNEKFFKSSSLEDICDFEWDN